MTRRALSLAWLLLLLAIPYAQGEDPGPIKAGEPFTFREALLDVHPRLLYTPDDIKTFRTPKYQKQVQWIFDAGAGYASSASSGHPLSGEPWNKGDGWQKYCWWRGVTAAQWYAFTGDPKWADDEIEFLMAIVASEHWELGGEQDYGMGAANIMASVAIMYDTYYDLLSDAQRKTIQRRLWLAADRFYHYGYTEERKLPNAGVRYWQSDPANNHRWHRLCGYLLGCLAIHGEVPEIDGYLSHAINEARFILRWLPPDGSCHESVAYTSYGASFLIPAFAALHRFIEDTDVFVEHPFIHNAPYWRAHNVLPGGQRVWAWGDGGWEPYYFAHYNFGAISMSQDATAQALHRQLFALHEGSYAYHGFNLTHYDVDLEPGNVEDAAPYRYFDDMGMAMWRANWTDADAAAAMFKCSVYGGHTLNEYRDSFSPPRYVNVAHDHPDANSFQFAWGGEVWAMEQDVGKDAKTTRQHNTLLVDGKGQTGEATRSGSVTWTQPIADMGTRAQVTEWFGAPGYGAVVGEAGGFYDALSSFKRTLIFVDGLYIVAVDEITVQRQPVTLDWCFHSSGAWRDLPARDDDDAARAWEIEKNGKRVHYIALTDAAVTAQHSGDDKMTTVQLTQPNARATVLVQVLLPQESDREREAATVTKWEIDGNKVYLEVERPGGVDRIGVNGWRDKDLTTDATVAVVTLPKRGKPRGMLVNGKRLEADKFTLKAGREVNAYYNDGGLWAVMPMAADNERDIRFDGPTIKQFNGADTREDNLPVPLWNEYLNVGY